MATLRTILAFALISIGIVIALPGMLLMEMGFRLQWGALIGRMRFRAALLDAADRLR